MSDVAETPQQAKEQPKEPLAQPKKAKRAPKLRLEALSPTHIVEVYRLFEHGLKEGYPTYPDITEDSPDHIRSHLFAYLLDPLTTGLIARVGKRSVGFLLGNVKVRPYGRPSRYAAIRHFFVEPSFRDLGIGHALWNDYAQRLKRAGVYHWEAKASPKLLREFQKEEGIGVLEIQSVLGGRF